MSRIKAFLFDLNGTMVDDMDYHIKAWHRIFTGLGASVTLHETKLQCYGKNAEVIERVMPGRFTDEEKHRMSIDKETEYQHAFRPFLKLINGLNDFLEQAAAAGVKMAIGSAAIMFNIHFVLNGLELHRYFGAVVSADDVVNSKPDPETFLKCAALLGVRPDECIVFEDAPKGVEAAWRAGMQSVVITSMHPEQDFEGQPGIIRFITDYTGITPLQLLNDDN